jgi:hypothetical protein
MAQSIAGSPSSHEASVFRQAYCGNTKALKWFFQEAVRREMGTVMHAADEEFLTWQLTALLCKMGDEMIASALARETPEVRSAVALFLPLDALKSDYQATVLILKDAPAIDFPLEHTVRKLDL